MKLDTLPNENDAIEQVLHHGLKRILEKGIFPQDIKSNVLIQTRSIFDDLDKEPGQRLSFNYYLTQRLSPMDGLQFLMEEGYFININIPRKSLLDCLDSRECQEKAFSALVRQIKSRMPMVQNTLWNDWIFMTPQQHLHDYQDYQAIESMNECFHRLRQLFPLRVDLRKMPELLDEEHVIKKVDAFDATWKKVHTWHIILNKRDLLTFCHDESPEAILHAISLKIKDQILQQHTHEEKRNHDNI